MFENEEFLQLVKQQLRRRQQDTDYFVQLASFQEFTSSLNTSNRFCFE